MELMSSLFDELRLELKTYLEPEQVEIIHRAFLLAYDAHKKQSRRSGEPYITHPIAVAHILCSLRMDYQSITAAILHDTIEDTPVEKTQLVEEFGQEIADLVDGVSKLSQIKFTTKAEAQAENFRKMLLAMSRDIRVILVKLADRLHNMRTIAGLPTEKREQKSIETLEIYAPIASRLGMYAFKMEFEDLGFAALYPMRYRIMKNAMDNLIKLRQTTISQIETSLKTCLEKQGLPPTSVWYHQRHLYSLYKKMKRQHLSFQEVMDFYSYRVVVEGVDTCYRVLGAIHNLYRPVPEHFRDYIAIPKSNGYQALHTTLFGPAGSPIEIQIRTTEMDSKAENGITARWAIKQDKGLNEAQKNTQNWLQSLMELQQQHKDNSIEFIENVKIDLFPKEVYVFTPRGKIMELPQSATPVDFAYAIHSDIGNTCIAAKIDKRIVPLSTILANGQTVEIVTAPGAKPNPAWLNFVVTGKSRSHIKNYLKELQLAESIALGKRLLTRTLKILGTPIEKISNKTLDEVTKKLSYKSHDGLYEAIGLGNQMATSIALRLTGQSEVPEKIKKKRKRSLAIQGTEGMVVKFAKCCRPIPGDPISGFFKMGHGIIVHIKNCPQAALLQNDPERYLPVRWEKEQEGEFKVDVKVEALNRRGVLAQITESISDSDANIEDIHLDQHDGNYCSLSLTLTIQNRTHLARVLRRLRSLKQVSRITRKSPG